MKDQETLVVREGDLVRLQWFNKAYVQDSVEPTSNPDRLRVDGLRGSMCVVEGVVEQVTLSETSGECLVYLNGEAYRALHIVKHRPKKVVVPEAIGKGDIVHIRWSEKGLVHEAAGTVSKTTSGGLLFLGGADDMHGPYKACDVVEHRPVLDVEFGT